MDIPLRILILVTSLLFIIVIVKLALWSFRAAVTAAISPTQARVISLEKQGRLIWDMELQRAYEKLHHADQPAFDLLLEDFRAHRMTEQQLTQFIERLEALTKDGDHPERMPAANLLLESALLEREARQGFYGVTDSQATKDENILAGEAMAKEAGDRKTD